MTDTFWADRFAAHGHTGWFDSKIYRFDQLLRLRIFENWVDCLRPGCALDFGCGSGDFSSLLLRKGWDVTAYDKFVSPSISDPRLKSTKVRSEIQGPFDLIVSITVLDCIMDDGDFAAELRALRTMLATDGRFFFLECSPSTPMSRNKHQAFRTASQWRDALTDASLRLDSFEPYFHPDNAPIPAWINYSHSLAVRGAGKLERILHRPQSMNWFRDICARAALMRHPYRPPAQSSINVFCGGRANG